MVTENEKQLGNTAVKSVEETQADSKEVSPARTRKLTVMKLQWVAERARKIERIRKALVAGDYNVDSKEVAKKILNLDLLASTEEDEQLDS